MQNIYGKIEYIWKLISLLKTSINNEMIEGMLIGFRTLRSNGEGTD